MLRKEVETQEMLFGAEEQDSVAWRNKFVWQYCLRQQPETDDKDPQQHLNPFSGKKHQENPKHKN